MTSITLKGREIPLLYTTYEMKTIQEEIAPIGQALKIVLGRNPDDENDMSLYGGAAHIEAASKLIRILGNAGLEENGEAADLTDKKVMRAIRPGDLALMVNACFDAMNEGMKSEIPEKKEEGPVDVTLEEMKKKETKDG
jgi:hypothetical protein